MKRTWVLLVAVAAITACSEPSELPMGPGDRAPSFELTDPNARVALNDVNAWVFGSFAVTTEGEPTIKRVLGMYGPEPASFPGIGVFYGGHCIYGMWYNPKGKPTSGTPDRPHPHCVEWGHGTITVILEPISAMYADPGSSDGHHLRLGVDELCGTGYDLKVKFVQAGRPRDGYPQSETKGCGLVDAYAIDASTIWTTKARVGTFSIDLSQYDTGKGTASATDLFDASCGGVTSLDGLSVTGCLSKEVEATYTSPSGATQAVTGYLYWENGDRTAKAYYNGN